jgi:hypothetical protein
MLLRHVQFCAQKGRALVVATNFVCVRILPLFLCRCCSHALRGRLSPFELPLLVMESPEVHRHVYMFEFMHIEFLVCLLEKVVPSPIV